MASTQSKVATLEASDRVGLYVESHGTGVPVVFSCGYCTTHENWRPQVGPLVAAGYRVVLHDFRGHGLSESPADASAYSMAQVIDDLSRVINWASPDQPVVLAGHSFGGLASLHYAAQNSKYDTARLLIEKGAKTDIQAQNGCCMRAYEMAKEGEMR
ncbi:MAG: alpha/beta fold hydrolase, partial [Myxococcota bacterium]